MSKYLDQKRVLEIELEECTAEFREIEAKRNRMRISIQLLTISDRYSLDIKIGTEVLLNGVKGVIDTRDYPYSMVIFVPYTKSGALSKNHRNIFENDKIELV